MKIICEKHPCLIMLKNVLFRCSFSERKAVPVLIISVEHAIVPTLEVLTLGKISVPGTDSTYFVHSVQKCRTKNSYLQYIT